MRRPSSREIHRTRRAIAAHRFDHLTACDSVTDADDTPSLPALGLALVRMDADAYRAGVA